MNDDAKELAKISAEAAVKPFADIFCRLLGPAADEIGATLANYFKAYRTQSAVRLFEKTRKTASEHGIDLGPISPKLFFSILENSTLEDDEDLHTIWSNLLVNASDIRNPVRVLPSYPEILKQLSKTEALFLEALFERYCTTLAVSTQTIIPFAFGEATLGDRISLISIFAKAGLTTNSAESLTTHNRAPGKTEDLQVFSITLDNLLRNNLLRLRDHANIKEKSDLQPQPKLQIRTIYSLTTLGYQFVDACRTPAKKAVPLPE